MSFKASVQYGDYEGTAAADRADQGGLRDYLEKNQLMSDGEFLIAVELWIGENHGGVVKAPSIRAVVVDAPNYDGAVSEVLQQNPIPVRKIDVPLTLDEFLGFFKRFAVTLTIKGGDLEGRESVEQQ